MMRCGAVFKRAQILRCGAVWLIAPNRTEPIGKTAPVLEPCILGRLTERYTVTQNGISVVGLLGPELDFYRQLAYKTPVYRLMAILPENVFFRPFDRER